MTKGCSVLFHDADGCLNQATGASLPFESGEMSAGQLSSLRELGIRIDASEISHFVLNTGRSWLATRFLCNAIASEKLQFVLVEHGAEMWNVQTDSQVDLMEVARISTVPEATPVLAGKRSIRELILWFEASGCEKLCQLLGYSGTLIIQKDKSWNLTFSVPAELDGDRVFALLKQLIARQEAFQTADFLFHYSRWNRFIDVMGAMNKGIGMALVMDMLSLPISSSAAVGDGLNDLSMLERAAVPVCPSNAEAAVIELCTQRGHASDASYIEATFDWLGAW